MLASPYYGSSGEVIEIDVKQSRVRVQLHVPPQPDLHSVIDKYKVGFLWEGVCLKKNQLPVYLLLETISYKIYFLLQNKNSKE